MFACGWGGVKAAGGGYNRTMGQVEEIRTRSAAETAEFGRRLAARLKVGDCVAMVGELGAGKTVLVRGIAAGLGVADHRIVSSPTFVLVQEYAGRVPIYHVDLYRLADPVAELAGLGLEEMLVGGVVLIEWADRVAEALPLRRWQVELTITGKTIRRVRVERLEA